jgi:hypothetical protein
LNTLADQSIDTFDYFQVRGLSGMLKSFTKTDPMERIPIVVDFLFSKKYLDELAPDGRTNREYQIDVRSSFII